MKSTRIPFGVIAVIFWGSNIAPVHAQPTCRDFSVIYFCTGDQEDVYDISDVPRKTQWNQLSFRGHRVTGFTNENLREFSALKIIILQSNGISTSFFEADVFSGIDLTELFITGNDIIFDEHFANVVNRLVMLTSLRLTENPGIINFNPAAITTFDRLSTFTFDETNIICDCDLSWFRNYLLNRLESFDELTAIMCPVGTGEGPITDSNFCSASGHITTGEIRDTAVVATNISPTTGSFSHQPAKCKSSTTQYFEVAIPSKNTSTLPNTPQLVFPDLVCLNCRGETNEECNAVAANETCGGLDPFCLNTIEVRNDVKMISKTCASRCNNNGNRGTCFGENPNRCLFCCRERNCNEPETTVLAGYYPPGYPFEPEIVTTTPVAATTARTTIVTTEPITTAAPTTTLLTTLAPTTTLPTTLVPTTTAPTTLAPMTTLPTTLAPTTTLPTTLAPTTTAPTTLAPTTTLPTTLAPTTALPTTLAPTTTAPTTLPTTEAVTTVMTTPPQTTASTSLLPTTQATTTIPTTMSTTEATTTIPTTMSTRVATTAPQTTTLVTTPLPTTIPTTPITTLMTTPDRTTTLITTIPTTDISTTTIASTESPTTAPLTTTRSTTELKTPRVTTMPQMTTSAVTTPRMTTSPTTFMTTKATTTVTTVAETTVRTTAQMTTASTTTEMPTTSAPSTLRSSTIATTPTTEGMTTPTSGASSTDGVTTTSTTTTSMTTTTELTPTTPDVTPTPARVAYCEEETNATEYGEIEWPRTVSGAIAIVECPVNDGDVRNNATRFCGSGRSKEHRHVAIWSLDANYTMCRTVHQGLEMLAEQNITAENVVEITDDLAELTDVPTTLNETDVENAVRVLEGAVMSIDVSEQNETEDVLENIIETVEHLSQVDDEQLLMAQQRANTSVRIIEAIEETVMSVEIEGDAFSSSSEVLDVEILKLNEDQTKDITFPSPKRGGENEDDEKEKVDGGSPQTVVTIPGSALKNAPRVQFLLYKDTSLFETITRTNKTGGSEDCLSDEACLRQSGALGSLVISASLGDMRVTNLEEPIVTTFYHLAGTGENETTNNSQCVFWDFKADNGRGDWSTDGCTVFMATDNATTCHCDHLTNFAVLLDIYQNANELPERHSRIITYISIGGATLSFFSLVLALASYSCAGKLRADKRVKVLLNLMVALLIMNMAFLFDVMVSEFGSESFYLCFGAAVAMHLSLLCVMTWMALEAFTMYLALVRVFDTKRSHFLLKMFLIGWGIPLLIVGASVGINREHYGYFNNLCYLDTIPFYITFFVPVCIVLMWNCIVYVLVIRQMHLLRKRQTEWNQTFSFQDQLKASFSLTFLLGLTWLFAFFAFGELNVVFSYLFATFNTLQGFIVFMFHCVLKREIRRQWQALCCPCIPLLKDGEDGTYTRSRSGTDSSNNTYNTRRNLLRNGVQLREHRAATDTRSRSWFWQRRRSDVESTSTNLTRISATPSDNSPASTLNRFPRDIDFSPASTSSYGRHVPLEDDEV